MHFTLTLVVVYNYVVSVQDKHPRESQNTIKGKAFQRHHAATIATPLTRSKRKAIESREAQGIGADTTNMVEHDPRLQFKHGRLQ